MDKVCIDLSSSRAYGFDLSEYEEQGELAREGLRLLGDVAPERQEILLYWAAFSDFLVERMPVWEKEWEDRRQTLRAAAESARPDGNKRGGRKQ